MNRKMFYFLSAAALCLSSSVTADINRCKLQDGEVSLRLVGRYFVSNGSSRLDYGVFRLDNSSRHALSLPTFTDTGITEVPDTFAMFYSRELGMPDGTWKGEIPSIDAIAGPIHDTRLPAKQSLLFSIPMGWLNHKDARSFSMQWKMELATVEGCRISSAPFMLADVKSSDAQDNKSKDTHYSNRNRQ